MKLTLYLCTSNLNSCVMNANIKFFTAILVIFMLGFSACKPNEAITTSLPKCKLKTTKINNQVILMNTIILIH